MWTIDEHGWLSAARACPSPNFDARPTAMEVDLLVVHYISLPPGRFGGDHIEALFQNRLDSALDPYFEQLQGLRVSAHFLIRRGGEVVQFVSTGQRAWHAGASSFSTQQGTRTRCNDFSIGVELEGDSQHRFTAKQYQQLASLTRCLARHYPLRWVAGHSDIAPGRKEDPGPLFDWQRFVKSISTSPITYPF